ncbi:MAG: rRNA maturation RNase YbeY [Phycisphaerales bacterium]|nr:rRNA maturation RNase YbeY [Phycisphaerales bacterium]
MCACILEDPTTHPPDAQLELSVQCERAVVRSIGEVSARALEHSIERWLRCACVALAHPVSRVHIEIVDAMRMAVLHQQFSNIAGATDVLTFPSNAAGEPVAADIAVCFEVAQRIAEELGHAVERELLLYALHGVLHCAGHDDHDPVAHARMHAEEDRILELIGVGTTFRPSERIEPTS